MASCSSSTSELKGEDTVQDHQYADFSLPPVDRGKDAWLFLAAGFMVEALTWGKSSIGGCADKTLTTPGVSFSYGVFQDYYSRNDEFKSSGNTAVIGTCALVRT